MKVGTDQRMSMLDDFDSSVAGEQALELISDLLPTPRSLTGNGNREALGIIAQRLSTLSIHELASGSPAFDWTIPPEWNVKTARLWGPDGAVIADYEEDPLALVGYSVSVDESLSLEDLLPHLHSIPERPHAIPYRTSYYHRDWGFCIPDETRRHLPEGTYRAVIESTLDEAGSLTYGEVHPVASNGNLFMLSAHICHPAQVNDNLTGMAVLTAVASWIEQHPTRRLGVRGLLGPGGMGSLAWLSLNPELAPRVAAGLSLACLGDPQALTFKSTRHGGAAVDRAAKVAAGEMGVELNIVEFDPYGFDERNFSSPGFDIPYGSLTRSPHGQYPEYHSSDDDLTLVTADRLGEAAAFVLRLIEVVDSNQRYRRTEPRGEPQLGKRGLYGSLGGLRQRPARESALLWVANLADGNHDLLAVAERTGLNFSDVLEAATLLEDAEVIYPEGGQAVSQSTSG